MNVVINVVKQVTLSRIVQGKDEYKDYVKAGVDKDKRKDWVLSKSKKKITVHYEVIW